MQKPIACIAFTLALCASARASVITYRLDVQDVDIRGRRVNTTAAPYIGGLPLNDFSSKLLLMEAALTGGKRYVDPIDGTIAPRSSLALQLQIDKDSQIAIYSQNTSDPSLLVFNSLNQLVDYDLLTGVINSRPFLDSVLQMYSLATLDGSEITALALLVTDDFGGYAFDKTTGAMTEVFGFTTGSGNGELSRTASFESYGPDGLVYVLDYGNQRVQVFAPCHDTNGDPCPYSYVRQFAIDAGVENVQFAIGTNGDLYLPDGAGGGYEYDRSGNFLGRFGLPNGYVNNQPLYLSDYAANLGSSGAHDQILSNGANDILVLDATGMHLYSDAPGAVPEPSSLAMMLAGGIAVFIAQRRRGIQK